jgi:hypothetical protein
MTANSSSTIAVTSEIVEKVAGALRETIEAQTSEQVARVARLRTRIQDLESRGFIRRQEFSAPSTGDFEKLLVYKTR